MALISDVLGIVVAIIIFIILVRIIFSAFGSPECDKLASATAEDLRIKIDKVALGDGISPYYGNGVPPDDAKNQFTVVPIRLCQKPKGAFGFEIPFTSIGMRIPVDSIGASLAAVIPDYILVYETWPEPVSYAGGFLSGWSESQPFSSGAVNAFLTYAMFRWGPKAIYNLAKIGSKILGKFLSAMDEIVGGRIFNFLIAHSDNRVFRFLFRTAFASELAKSVPKDIPLQFIENLYKEEYRGVISDLRYMVFEKNVDLYEAMANLGIIESEWDEAAGKYIPVTSEKYFTRGLFNTVVKDEVYVVNPEFRGLFKTYIGLVENDELRTLYQDTFYIPSSWAWTENIKVKWYKFEYSVFNNRFTDWFSENVVQPTKDTYGWLKGGFNKVFRRSVNQFDAPEEAAAYKRWAFMHFDQFRDYVLDEDNFQNFRQVLEDVTGKALLDSSWVSDEDLYNFLIKTDRYYNSFSYDEFISRSTGQIRSFAITNLDDIVDTAAEEAIQGGDWGAWMTFKNKWGLAWDQMTDTQKGDWIDKFMQGYTGTEQLSKYDAGVIYSDFRAHLINEGVLDQGKIVTHGQIRINQFSDMIDRAKGDMFTAPLNPDFLYSDEFASAIPNYWLRPVAPATGSWFKKFSENVIKYKDLITNNMAYKKAKQFVILDLGRFGNLPLGPFDPLGGGGAYTAKETLRRASQIMQGGCAERSICMLKAGEVQGPEQSESAYLLDEKIPQGTEVRLWRPKPSLADRTPIWMSTALFYATVPENPRFHVVSPCFATAKIWKSGKDGKIYVNIDKTNKCDVTGCHIDTPNYCYADEEYIWGQDLGKGDMITTGDAPSAALYVGGAAGCAAVMTVATEGNFWTALKTCSYSFIGLLSVHATTATIAYRDVPSWKRQETGWGYWNYQKANDICNILDIMASIGTWQAGKGTIKLTETQPGAWWTKSVETPGTLAKLGGKIKSNLGIGDLCYAMLAVGDTSLSWPIKTMFPEIWRKGAGLNETCMQNTAPECAWLNKTA